jgi:hypothetical protein
MEVTMRGLGMAALAALVLGLAPAQAQEASSGSAQAHAPAADGTAHHGRAPHARRGPTPKAAAGATGMSDQNGHMSPDVGGGQGGSGMSTSGSGTGAPGAGSGGPG